MFENMNFEDKDIELFVNAITEILELPDEVINEANIEEIEKAMIAGLSGADREQAIKETVIKMKAQGYTKEKVEEMITEYENSLKDIIEEVANYTSNPYKIRIINKIFEKGESGKENHSGIGLWEVKKYVNKSKNLDLFTSKTNEFFKQELSVYDIIKK